MGEHILVMEDDRELGNQIAAHLRKAGFECTLMTEGEALLPGALTGVSLLILDLMLPRVHGLDVLKRLRSFSDIPVLVLSARSSSADKVRALRLGADDYMTKPFWPEELVERVRARLRRPALHKGGPFQLGQVQLDFASRRLLVRGKAVDLTRVEFDILAALANRAGEAVTRRWLVDNILDPEKEGTERTLDVHVSRIRKKLGAENVIETVWGIGYRLRTEDES